MRTPGFVGILPIVSRFGSKVGNEFEYAGQPTRIVHPPPTADAEYDGEELSTTPFSNILPYPDCRVQFMDKSLCFHYDLMLSSH